MGETRGNPTQEMVFLLTKDGVVENVRYAMEKHHYQQLIKQGKELEDFSFREKILHFLEIFRTAYNQKNIGFLETTYSDDALIIVGTVIQKDTTQPDMLEKSSLSDDKIRFIKLSKAEYIANLRRVFTRNAFVKVQFDSVDVMRHPKHDEIYGITLKQRWNSSTYSDEGYLFLMMDFINEHTPIIHVRSWQPDKFKDGSVVSLYDFELL